MLFVLHPCECMEILKGRKSNCEKEKLVLSSLHLIVRLLSVLLVPLFRISFQYFPFFLFFVTVDILYC